MSRRPRSLMLLVAFLAHSVQATGLPRPFDATTPAALEQRYAGRPYILAFWSLGCGYCLAELESFANRLKARPGLPLVLVATDAPDLAPAVATRLEQLGLRPASQWSFADDMPERVRFAVDRQWRGELPRTYLFDARHQVQAVSGAMEEARLDEWLAVNLPQRP
jgi:thiol-disulfide isomerase/thioredoxin